MRDCLPAGFGEGRSHPALPMALAQGLMHPQLLHSYVVAMLFYHLQAEQQCADALAEAACLCVLPMLSADVAAAADADAALLEHDPVCQHLT